MLKGAPEWEEASGDSADDDTGVDTEKQGNTVKKRKIDQVAEEPIKEENKKVRKQKGAKKKSSTKKSK